MWLEVVAAASEPRAAKVRVKKGVRRLRVQR